MKDTKHYRLLSGTLALTVFSVCLVGCSSGPPQASPDDAAKAANFYKHEQGKKSPFFQPKGAEKD